MDTNIFPNNIEGSTGKKTKAIALTGKSMYNKSLV